MTTNLDTDTLKWAAQWIQDSLKGETNEGVIEFGNNMAMTLRAAAQPAASTPTEPQVSFGPEPTTAGQKQVVIHDYGDRKVYTSQPPKPFEPDDPPTSEAARAHGLRRINRRHYDPEARNLPAAASTEAQWQPIETAPEYKTVLTIHRDDLYPVCAFHFWQDGRQYWMRTIEGPEDVIRPEQGDHQELLRPPTHWILPPSPPIAAIGDDKK